MPEPKGWYCETCNLLNSIKAENCATCGTVHKVVPDPPEERKKRMEFVNGLRESDAKYLSMGDFKAVATPNSAVIIPGQEPPFGTIGWFQRKWNELSEYNKKFIREKYNNRYKFGVSISPDIKRGNIVVFYLEEPLRKIAGKYGHTLEEALRILHDVTIGELPENHEFIKEAFNDKFMSEKK